ncbi:MAG: cbb3-type cytochrome oxidase assembly protein CcoS [Magnetococcales bacterium]|nr:cbb3-type cytochrome oxidase assembly protein CcoS [Magnetococcales bacterium]MBF0151233.1 cbb3-type cytochrome oxidase assembly protein CcoS [Magnetococcales bacterium]MBF0175148.1 cbb3-type cytochrome oxidase assembly protein CcoS [Magnetococcales bacterium]MBF0349027.1 cbb3-type cytochrome oxidase assembly protein CcoS [Magnetococcales bacterium]MBF0632202.1 cbb3-type cytochrome oxidase assembly protein CcoS [Magnetococcales bacterium]
MESVFVLLPIALILGGIGLMWMLWAVRTGQFEDMEGPAHRILFDDDQDLIPDDSSDTVDGKTDGNEKGD